MIRDRFSRRKLLAGLGLSPALLPLLVDEVQGGCLTRPPLRSVFVVWPNGVLDWVKGTSPTDFVLPDYMAALEPYRSDLLFFDQLRFQNLYDSPGNNPFGHGAVPALLTGFRYRKLEPYLIDAGGPSVDQHIGTWLAKTGYTGRPALVLGALFQGSYFSSWRAAGHPVPPDNDPYHVFDTLFAKAPGTGGDLQLARAINTRRSILDYVSQDLARFSRTLGTEDRQRVDGHLQSVREIEQQLTPRPVPGGCTVPTLGDPIDVKITESFDKVTRLQMDIAVAALAADFTRVVVLELSDSASAHIIPYWLGLAKSRDAGTGTGDVNSHHTIAHANGATKRRLDGWFHETFAYLIGKLKGEKEAGKTILDSAAVLFANNMGNGAAHNITNVPWFMAGSCGGAFKTGRSLKTGNVPQTRVLNEIISAMGAPTAGFADVPYQGELPDLRG